MEVASCDADHEGEWDGEWEECEVVADHGRTCDVRIVEDGQLCRGVPRRLVRAIVGGVDVSGLFVSPRQAKSPKGVCGTPGCGLPDHHIGPCACEASGPRRGVARARRGRGAPAACSESGRRARARAPSPSRGAASGRAPSPPPAWRRSELRAAPRAASGREGEARGGRGERRSSEAGVCNVRRRRDLRLRVAARRPRMPVRLMTGAARVRRSKRRATSRSRNRWTRKRGATERASSTSCRSSRAKCGTVARRSRA